MSAPDVTMPDTSSSKLGSAMGNSSPQMPTYDPSQEQQANTDLPANASDNTPSGGGGGGSRLQAVLAAVAKVGSTALSGVPDRGRASFAGGLGEGARADQAALANQQTIKFKTFDDQIRAAQLHNQDLEMQGRVQAVQDAHDDHEAAMNKQAAANDWGVTHDTIANNSDAVMQHMQTQQATNGSVSVPPGTHVSADGKTINIPQDTPSNDASMLKEYNALGPVFNMAKAPSGATKLPPPAATAFYNLKQGYDATGNVITADKLPGIIASNQAKLDDIGTNGGSDAQKTLLQGIITKQQAQLKADNDQLQASNQSKAAGTVAGQTSPSAVAGEANKAGAVANAQLPAKIAEQNNAADNKAANAKPDAQMYQATDQNGNVVAGSSDQLKAAGITSGITKLDADTGKKVTTARELISPDGLFSLIRQDMDSLNAKGKLGSSATARLNDALLQKAGADADYAPLFDHTHLLATALMQAHVGSRGSGDMMGEFQKLANAGKMNADTLRASLGAEYNYVHGKAMLPKAQQTTPSGGGQ